MYGYEMFNRFLVLIFYQCFTHMSKRYSCNPLLEAKLFLRYKSVLILLPCPSKCRDLFYDNSLTSFLLVFCHC